MAEDPDEFVGMYETVTPAAKAALDRVIRGGIQDLAVADGLVIGIYRNFGLAGTFAAVVYWTGAMLDVLLPFGPGSGMWASGWGDGQRGIIDTDLLSPHQRALQFFVSARINGDEDTMTAVMETVLSEGPESFGEFIAVTLNGCASTIRRFAPQGPSTPGEDAR